MKTFLTAVKICGALDAIAIIAWLILLGLNPPMASHVAMLTLLGAAALVAGGLLSAPLWLPLVILIAALVTGNSILGFVTKHVPEALAGFRQKLFGGAL